MKMKFIKCTIFILFIVEACCGAAQARTQQEILKDLDKATDTAIETYKTVGMAGLSVYVQECYEKNMGNLYYCVYFDLASRHIDQFFVIAMNFPPNDFFTDEIFGSRVRAVLLVGKNMGEDDANKYIASVTPLVNAMVDQKILGKYNSRKAQ